MKTLTSSPPHCTHEPKTVDGLLVVACGDCGEVSFRDAGGSVARRAGLARLFGQFDLEGSLPAVGAPAREVLLYRAPNGRARRGLHCIPSGAWLEVDDGLWLSHDGEHLLLAHDAPWITRRLLDGA